MEKVLEYDRSIVPQETGYWCGPASTQMVLNNRGIFRSEASLAQRMGTHTGGTDHIGLPARVLNEELGGGYIVRVMPNDPPSPAQVELLWQDIVGSIDADYGVVANIVAPSSNYPRGVNGSVSPAYAGGTVYHYIALMGYADHGNGRFVWVADSGFRPFGYWVTLEQLASLIPPKGYAAKPVAAQSGGGGTGLTFKNSDGVTTNEAVYMHWTDKRLASIEKQLRGPDGKGWPQLGGFTVLGAISRILKELENGR